LPAIIGKRPVDNNDRSVYEYAMDIKHNVVGWFEIPVLDMEIGHYGLFLDTEGNRIAVHSLA
jgi:predicted enzyme related to lactoylglutathione lyase